MKNQFVSSLKLGLILLIVTGVGRSEGSEMSMQTPIARIKKINDETYQVDMMPPEETPRIIKKGDSEFNAYAAKFSKLRIGGMIHVTKLPSVAVLDTIDRLKPSAEYSNEHFQNFFNFSFIRKTSLKTKRKYWVLESTIVNSTMSPNGVMNELPSVKPHYHRIDFYFDGIMKKPVTSVILTEEKLKRADAQPIQSYRDGQLVDTFFLPLDDATWRTFKTRKPQQVKIVIFDSEDKVVTAVDVPIPEYD